MKKLSRRNFLIGAGQIIAGFMLAAPAMAASAAPPEEKHSDISSGGPAQEPAKYFYLCPQVIYPVHNPLIDANDPSTLGPMIFPQRPSLSAQLFPDSSRSVPLLARYDNPSEILASYAKPGVPVAYCHYPLALTAANGDKNAHGKMWFQIVRTIDGKTEYHSEKLPYSVNKLGGKYDLSDIISYVNEAVPDLSADKKATWGIQFEFKPPAGLEYNLGDAAEIFIPQYTGSREGETFFGYKNTFIFMDKGNAAGYLEYQVPGFFLGNDMDIKTTAMPFFAWTDKTPRILAVKTLVPEAVTDKDGNFLDIYSNVNKSRFTSANDSRNALSLYSDKDFVKVEAWDGSNRKFTLHCVVSDSVPLYFLQNTPVLGAAPSAKPIPIDSSMVGYNAFPGQRDLIESRIPDSCQYIVVHAGKPFNDNTASNYVVSSADLLGLNVDGPLFDKYGINVGPHRVKAVHAFEDPFTEVVVVPAIGVGYEGGKEFRLRPLDKVHGYSPFTMADVSEQKTYVYTNLGASPIRVNRP